jgi:hypothetical protein
LYYRRITYQNLHDDLGHRSIAELSMTVQAVFLDKIHSAKALRYTWSEDKTVLLTLDCHGAGDALTFADLRRQLRCLCPWQLSNRVVIGVKHALAEVVTMYHEFDLPSEPGHSLMLVCTPPDEYFDAVAA